MSLNPEMLTLARESRGFTQTSLAQKLGVSQGKISKYETGLLEVSKEELARISVILDYPEEFFFQGDTVYGLTDVVYYRKRQGLPISEQKIIEAQVNVLRMRVMRLLRGVDLESPNQFARLDVDSFAGGPQEIARRVRADWHLPAGPIRSVTGAIEIAGGVVFRRSFGTTQLDAVIQSPNGLCPLFVVNANIAAGDRLRFTLAHEIGHVVMRNSLSPDPEKEANEFASEFLMPVREIAGDLNDFGLAKAASAEAILESIDSVLIRRIRSRENQSAKIQKPLCRNVGQGLAGQRTYSGSS